MLIVRKTVALLLMVALLGVTGCARYHYEGAAAGGAVGGLAGALLDHRNPWRGGVIGAALGAAFGATLAEVSAQGRREAVYSREPVEYRTRANDGTTAVYRADPLEYNPRTECHKVRERIWQDGRLVKDQLREVCESEKIERRY
jgi:hypothetical protein